MSSKVVLGVDVVRILHRVTSPVAVMDCGSRFDNHRHHTTTCSQLSTSMVSSATNSSRCRRRIWLLGYLDVARNLERCAFMGVFLRGLLTFGPTPGWSGPRLCHSKAIAMLLPKEACQFI